MALIKYDRLPTSQRLILICTRDPVEFGSSLPPAASPECAFADDLDPDCYGPSPQV